MKSWVRHCLQCVVYQNIFVLVVTGELEVAGRRQYGLDGSHPVVVVELSGQLLGTQTVRGHDLDGQVARVHEAVRVQTDLGDHRVVGNHHRHRPKQNLQVIQSGRACRAWYTLPVFTGRVRQRRRGRR